jgi:AhpD family alkylhydroperoxidase
MDHNKFVTNFAEFVGKSDETKKFVQFSSSAFKGGELDAKTKELIALACGVVSRCEYCIRAHMEAALKAGAEEREIIETLNVVIAMSGGPGISYSTLAYSIMKELKG